MEIYYYLRSITASGWLKTKSIAIAAPRLGPTKVIGFLI